MNEHVQVIMNCAAKFPELRFGQFICNVMASESGSLFYMNDRDLAAACKGYCIMHSR